MATVTHVFQSAIADDAAAAAAGEVLPSHWNAAHSVTLTPADVGRSISGYFPGATASLTGTLRLYPNVAGTLVKLSVWATGAVPTNTTVAINKNGAALTSATITAGGTTGSAVISLAVLAADYFTADLTSTGAADVGFRLDF